MKKIKYIVCFFLLLFCFLVSGELYQNHLDSFTNGLYYFSSSDVTKDQFSDMKALSSQNNCEVFCIRRKTESMLMSSITVFSDEKTADKIQNILDVYPGKFNSLFSGSTKVEFKDFLSAPAADTTFFFFGNQNDIKNVRDICNQTYSAGAVHKNNIDSAQWLMPVLWIVFAVLILLLTKFDIQFQQKENFILISLGKSNRSLILKNILKDTVYMCGLYAALYFILKRHTSLVYREKETIFVFTAILIMNALSYLSICNYDLKKALSSSSFSNSVLANCYVIKAITLIITIVILSTNVLLIEENSNTLLQYKKVSAYKDYYYTEINYDPPFKPDEKEFERGIDSAAKIEKNIFYELYKENKISFSVFGMNSSGCDYLLIDKNAKNLISDISELNQIDFTKDYYILTPENLNSKKQTKTAQAVFDLFFEEISNNASYDALTYKGIHNIIYFKSEKDKITCGFKTVVNPVIILCNFSDRIIDNALEKNQFRTDDSTNNMMFKITEEDIESWEDRYHFDQNSFSVTTTSVTDQAEYAKAAIERIVLLNTVISAFMILLEFMIMATTVKLEYTVNAMTVSLTRILGYSILERNKAVFLLNLFSLFVAVFTTVIASVMMRLEIWKTALVIGAVIMLFESLAVCYYVLKLDRISVPKILKGGSL